MTPGVSAGSNQVGASVTVAAKVTWPAGVSERPDGAGTWPDAGSTKVSTSATAGTGDDQRAISSSSSIVRGGATSALTHVCGESRRFRARLYAVRAIAGPAPGADDQAHAARRMEPAVAEL